MKYQIFLLLACTATAVLATDLLGADVSSEALQETKSNQPELAKSLSHSSCECAKETGVSKEADAINRFIVITEDGNKLKVTTIRIPADAELTAAVLQDSISKLEAPVELGQQAASTENSAAKVELESEPEKVPSEKELSAEEVKNLPEETKKPVEDAKKPVEDVVKPVEDVKKPVEDTKTAVEEQNIKKEAPSESKKQSSKTASKQKKQENKRTKRDVKLKSKSKESWKNKLSSEKKSKGKYRK